MRGTSELRRILLVANLALLAILVYVIAYIIFAKNTRQEYATNSKAGDTKIKTELSKEPSPAGSHRIILERNIFGSNEVDTVKKEQQKDKPLAQPPKPVVPKQLELRLIGTVAGDDQVACAIIEDLSNKAQNLYRIGDIIQGSCIEKIEQNKVVLLNNGRHEVLNLSLTKQASAPVEIATQPSVTEEAGVKEIVKITSPTERKINKEAFLAKVGGMSTVLNKVKLSPHVVNGKEEGICINGLENFGLAKYAGFENGDVIQTINNQKITNGRKAFQVFRKARTLPSSDIQLLRGTEVRSLSFAVDSGR
jgi:type II secretion system protein C